MEKMQIEERLKKLSGFKEKKKEGMKKLC